MIAAGFEAGMIAGSFKLVTKRRNGRGVGGLAADDPVPPERLEHAQLCCQFNTQRVKPPQLFIFPRVGLAEQVGYMPQEVFDRTGSGGIPPGGPQSPRPCARGPACLRRAPIGAPRPASAGPDVYGPPPLEW